MCNRRISFYAPVYCGIINPAVGWPPLNPQYHIEGR